MRWLLAAIVMFLLAYVLQAGLVVYASIALGAVAAANYWLASEGLRHVDAEREVSHREIDVGATIEVKLRIKNRSRRPMIWLLIEDLAPESALIQRPPRMVIKGRRLRIRLLRAGQTAKLEYKATIQQRGVYPIGPAILESGDLFGFFRRYKVVAPPVIVTALPKAMPLSGYDIASRRPIGDVRLTHRLYEDPTRISGVREYLPGDPLNRIHWKATGRTGQLHSKVFEPSTLAGATLLVDYHASGYPLRGEPYRSELVATTAASIANSILQLNQQIGLWSNGCDGAKRWVESMVARLRRQANVSIDEDDFRLADTLRQSMTEKDERQSAEVLGVPTRRGWQQLIEILRLLARLDLTDDRPFADFLMEVAPRMPRDATALAIVPDVSGQTAVALGSLRRAGFAVAVIIVIPPEDAAHTMVGHLAREGIRDVRVLEHESQLMDVCEARVRPAVVPLMS